jgi:hypothetical protein
MAKDNRLYAKFTLEFPGHAKILPLTDAAFRCIVEATLYSREHLTDGYLARRYAVARWGLEVLRELCENDPENPSLIESEEGEGWLIHDYAEIQDTKAEVEARRERNSKAGQLGGLAKAKQVAKQVASKSLSENVAETETEAETETSPLVTFSGEGALSNAREPHPLRCPKHENEVGPVPPCRACGDARKAAEAHATADELAARAATAQRRKAIDGCGMCDDQGMRDVGRGAIRCGHLSAVQHA